MTRRRPAGDEAQSASRDALRAALKAYGEAFPGREVWTWEMPAGRILPLAAALQRAVRDGLPLDPGKVIAIAGVAPPADGDEADPPPRELDPWDALSDAIADYRRQFGPDGTIWTWRMERDRIPLLARALKAAIRAGRPLSLDEISAVSGVSPPPLGACG